VIVSLQFVSYRYFDTEPMWIFNRCI